MAGAGPLKPGSHTQVPTGARWESKELGFVEKGPGAPGDLGQAWEGMHGEGSPSQTPVETPGPHQEMRGLEPPLSQALQPRASACPDASLIFGLKAPSCPEEGKSCKVLGIRTPA